MHTTAQQHAAKLRPATLACARRRLIQMHFDSGVGHLGGNLSCIDAMLLVFHEYLRADDRFVLSKGHSAGALYVSLWSLGRLDDADLKTFHKEGTRLPGHPPASGIGDIPFATGSLGHGLSLAAGTALAMRLKGTDGRVVCLTSDGEWQEGSTWEALIFLAHQKLTNLTVLVDHNALQGFGSTAEVASMNPLWERLRGFDVDVLIADGHDLQSVREALASPSPRPKIVVMRTVKGKGISFLEGRMDSHYLPLKEAQFHAAMLENPAS